MRNNGLVSRLVQGLDRKLEPWHRHKLALQVLGLAGIRETLRARNLHDTGGGLPPDIPVNLSEPRDLARRTVDGSFTDIGDVTMGMAGRRFTRNVAVDRTRPDDPNVLEPNPRVISNELLKRDHFKPAKILNNLAAAWIQFQVHDWTNHGKFGTKEHRFELEIPDGDDWPLDDLWVLKTPVDRSRTEGDDVPPTYRNVVTHWWDASQIYASDQTHQDLMREGRGGRLKMDGDLLPLDPRVPWPLDLTGVNENYWIGLALLHTVFVKEHNAIADELARHYTGWSDDKLFDKARLINAALIAKIHTIEWTPGILPTRALDIAMHTNWYGALRGRLGKFPGLRRSDLFTGIPTSKTDHHGAPYSITEEFVSVYRLHALIADSWSFRSLDDNKEFDAREFQDVAGRATRGLMENNRQADLFYSLGTSHPGAITLHNFPHALRQFRMEDDVIIDLAATDIIRDRERGVPRYNDFRELFHMGRLRSFDELSSNPEWNAELKDVYNGEIDMVDQHVGLMAENPPTGFGFSDTAFRVFVLMASRRLKSDRFFTTDYNEHTYTKIGLDWIEQNTMRDVLLRHHPELERTLAGVANAFAPWKTAGA